MNITDYVARTRQAQGFAPKITDETALATIAALLTDEAPAEDGGSADASSSDQADREAVGRRE